jgi:hypothetical protein
MTPDAFERWWSTQFWGDAYTDDDKATALAGWRAAALDAAPIHEKVRTLRRVCAELEHDGWKHITIASVRAVLGETP